MNIDTIIDEIAEINDAYFNEILEVIDDIFNFMDDNSLIEPKKNYLILFNFLNTTVNHFKNLDYEFASETLNKLHKNINILHKIYQTQISHQNTLNEIFQNNVFTKIPIFKEMKKEILDIENNGLMDNYDIETISIIKNQYQELKKIYFEYFKDDYMEQNNYIIGSLKTILNSKLYYLDQLLWIEVNKSTTIIRSLKAIKIKNNISSKSYIKYRLSVALPYTSDYEYLKKCLRIYK